MKKLFDWFKGLFDAESSVSSKRFVGIMMAVWSMTMSTYYIVKIQHFGGVESNTTVSVLEFAFVSACGLLAGGTLAESLGKSKTKKGNDDVE